MSKCHCETCLLLRFPNISVHRSPLLQLDHVALAIFSETIECLEQTIPRMYPIPFPRLTVHSLHKMRLLLSMSGRFTRIHAAHLQWVMRGILIIDVVFHLDARL